MMKNAILGGALLLMSSLSASAMTQTLDLSNVTGARLSFTPVVGPAGFTFAFVNSADAGLTNADQRVTGLDPNPGTLGGMLAPGAGLVDVTGLWRVDKTAIFSCGGTTCQQAPVASGNPGKIIFRNGAGTAGVAADLTLANIKSFTNTASSGPSFGFVQVTAGLNVGKFSNFGGYAGGNPDLDALKQYAAGSYTVSFQSNGFVNLQSLVTKSFNTSFSSTLTMVPEPSFYGMMLAPAVAGVLFLARKRKQADNA